MNAIELEAFIQHHRDDGGTTLRLFNDCAPLNVDIKKQLKMVIETAGFEPIGGDREVDLPYAERILISVLHRNMAYQSCRYFSLDDASVVARRFLDFFPPETRYFTNGHFDEWVEPDSGRSLLDLRSWNSITRSTFETGVIAISPAVQGIMWFEDED